MRALLFDQLRYYRLPHISSCLIQIIGNIKGQIVTEAVFHQLMKFMWWKLYEIVRVEVKES